MAISRCPSSAKLCPRPTSPSRSTRRSPGSSGISTAETKYKRALAVTRPYGRSRAGMPAQSSIVFHPGFLLGLERERALDGRRRPARRLARATRGRGPSRPVRRRGDGAGPRPRHARRRCSRSRPASTRPTGARFRASARDERRGLYDRRAFASAIEPTDEILEPDAPFHIHFSDIAYANGTRRSICRTAREPPAPNRFATRWRSSTARDGDQRIPRRSIDSDDLSVLLGRAQRDALRSPRPPRRRRRARRRSAR